MTVQEIIAKGTVISTGAAQTINIASGFDMFILRNRTTLAAGAGIFEAKWWYGMVNGTAETKSVAGGAVTDAIIAAGGFTYIDSQLATIGPAFAITGVSQANGAVVLSATTPLVNQIVRVYGVTGMQQISSMDFTATAVNAGVSMTFGYLNSAAFAAPGTGGFWRLIPVDLKFYPRRRYITAITLGAQTIVQMSVVHDFVIGEKVSFRCTPAFGTSQIDKLTGTVTAISTVNNTITVDIDSSAFTAFAFPTSAVAALGVTFPQVIPAGELVILTGAVRDTGTRSIVIGASIAGTALDVFDYWAIRSELI